jgi:ABC-2 type transport system ATP-binding protein
VTLAIETRELERRFGSLEAVHGLDLAVPQGSIFALIGPNGAGKTTTLKMLVNLVRPSGGRATVLGTDSRRLGPRDFRRIGYVSENQELPGWMTPRDLCDYCRPFYPTWDNDLQAALERNLDLDLRQPLRQLSRGTRMKAALLSSLAYRPELVVLDEPFSGLDPLVRDELTRGLLEASGSRTWTVLLASHDIEEVERLADWIGFIDRGRLVFAEPVASLLERFRLVEVVAPDGSAPVLPEGISGLSIERAGRTLRFVDDSHSTSGTEARLAAAIPGAEISSSPVPLREIFVALARDVTSKRRALEQS